jgi:hypothetical protein
MVRKANLQTEVAAGRGWKHNTLAVLIFFVNPQLRYASIFNRTKM